MDYIVVHVQNRLLLHNAFSGALSLSVHNAMQHDVSERNATQDRPLI